MEVAKAVKMFSGKTLYSEDFGRVSVIEMGNRIGCGLTQDADCLTLSICRMNVASKPFARNCKMFEDKFQLDSGRFDCGSRHAGAPSPSGFRVISWRSVRSLVG